MLRIRRTSVSRMETFSDAVFAFSATLLVVSLEVPTSFRDLALELRGFVAFGVSFAALILIWSIHNAYFRRYGLHDRVTVILNACLLFVVLFYVFPLKFVAEGVVRFVLGVESSPIEIANLGELSSLFILYGAGFVAVFLCVALMYRHAYARRAGLGLSLRETHEARFHFRHYLIFVGVGVLSIVTAWSRIGLEIALPGMIYFLLGPLCYFHARESEKRF